MLPATDLVVAAGRDLQQRQAGAIASRLQEEIPRLALLVAVPLVIQLHGTQEREIRRVAEQKIEVLLPYLAERLLALALAKVRLGRQYIGGSYLGKDTGLVPHRSEPAP